MSFLRIEPWVGDITPIQRIWAHYRQDPIEGDDGVIVARFEQDIAGIAVVPPRGRAGEPDRIIETGLPGAREPLIIACVQYRISRGEECTHTGYRFSAHGRCCPHCGVIMTDFGD